jgi:Tc5 transposase DNA-binding domain.
MEHMEKMLNTWTKDQNQHHVPVSKLLVQAKSHSIYEDVSKDDGNIKPFSANTGWFSRFMTRYNFYKFTMIGEAASADNVAAEKF